MKIIPNSITLETAEGTKATLAFLGVIKGDPGDDGVDGVDGEDGATPDDIYVNIAGDVMTGTLGFKHEDYTDVDQQVNLQPTVEGDLNIASTDSERSIYIGVNTANQNQDIPFDPDSDQLGAVVIGRMRHSIPIYDMALYGELLHSGSLGVGSAVTLYETADEDEELFIRKNDNTAGQDWFLGNFFSFCNIGAAGNVTIKPETEDVILWIPPGYIASPRDRYSVITCTLVRCEVTESEGIYTPVSETWLVSGDLALEPVIEV